MPSLPCGSVGSDGWSGNIWLLLDSPSATDTKGGHNADPGMTDAFWPSVWYQDEVPLCLYL